MVDMPRNLALALVLMAAAAGLPAQDPVGPSRPASDDVRARLKKAVDRSLARFVRELRAELHRAIDETVADGSIEDLLRDLEGRNARPVVAKPGPAPARPTVVLKGEELVRADRLLRSFDRLVDRAGSADPRVRDAATGLRAALGDDVFELSRMPWHVFGLSVKPVAEQVRAAWKWAPMEGLEVQAVDVGSAAERAGFKKGWVLVGTGIGRSGGLLKQMTTLSVIDVRVHKDLSPFPRGHGRAGETVRLKVPRALEGSPAIDSKALMEEMLRKAIRDVVPRGGVIMPADGGPRAGTKPKPGGQ